MKSMMTKILMTVFLTMTVQVSTSQADVKESMKQIGAIFKTLTMQYNDPSLNMNSADLASQLSILFTQTLNEVPKVILDLPAAEQEAALAEYKGFMQKEIDSSLDLQKAFLSNDNATAFTILKSMSQIAGQAHDLFK